MHKRMKDGNIIEGVYDSHSISLHTIFVIYFVIEESDVTFVSQELIYMLSIA